MQKTKIEWTDAVWNPVWGCLNQGECRKFCYARKLAKRFAEIVTKKEIKYCTEYHFGYYEDLQERLYNFKPTFLVSHFDKPFPKKPCRIFVGSMSEIYFWKKEWMVIVLEKIKQYPQHIFQFLTKFPEVYEKYEFPINCWLGTTITWGQYNYIPLKKLKCNNIKFISFEPLQADVAKYTNMEFCDWIIVGMETGNRKGKIIPKKKWIDNIINFCEFNLIEKQIPIFLKDNLKSIYPDLIQEFPK